MTQLTEGLIVTMLQCIELWYEYYMLFNKMHEPAESIFSRLNVKRHTEKKFLNSCNVLQSGPNKAQFIYNTVARLSLSVQNWVQIIIPD